MRLSGTIRHETLPGSQSTLYTKMSIGIGTEPFKIPHIEYLTSINDNIFAFGSWYMFVTLHGHIYRL
jgi:hypothetical protein